MYRPSPVRNQRSKGIKIKHVLQVCLLVAVCFWLIFQVKRSHDKKQEFDANDPKISSTTHAHSDENVKFGRKDLQPKLEETTKETELHEEVEEQEQEHEEIKNEVEDQDQDEDKVEDEKDDEIDENEQEKLEVDVDRDEMNTMDEDKETEEENDEKENEEKNEQNQTENTGSLDDHDEDGSTTVHTHEAREEHYKADDASSAVTNENTNGTLDNSNGNIGLVDNNQTPKTVSPSNTTIIREIISESINTHENEPPLNTTTKSTQAQNVTEGVTDYISEVLKSNESNSSKTEVENETLESYETKPEDLDQNETIDSLHLEEKEVRTDLETLPEIETEGGNSEDSGAE